MAILKYLFASLKKLFGQARRPKKSVSRKSASRTVAKKRKPSRSSPSSKSRKSTKKIKTVPRPAKPPQKTAKKENEALVGEITHYFSKIQVVVVRLSQNLAAGDRIRIRGSAEFVQKVASMQIESVDVRQARRGQLIGLKVIQEAKVGDKVFKVL